MIRSKSIILAAFAAFVIVPATAAFADSPGVSYSAKKQGRVAFEEKTQDEAAAIEDSTDASNPADIEPAAGGYEPEGMEEDSVAKNIKLPRKN